MTIIEFKKKWIRYITYMEKETFGKELDEMVRSECQQTVKGLIDDMDGVYPEYHKDILITYLDNENLGI